MTPPAEGELGALIVRIRRLADNPEDVGGPFRFLTRPFYRIFKSKPELTVERITALLGELDGANPEPARLRLLLSDAIEELGEDVDALERACIADGKPPAAHLLWVWRLYGVVARAARAVADGDRGGYRVAGATDPRILAPPLTTKGPVDAEQQAPIAPVGLVDALLDAARAEADHLGRKRRLIEVARHVLLEVSVACELDEGGMAARREWMAREIQAINTVEAAGVSMDVGLLLQAKQALSRGNREALHAAISALDGVAGARGDLALGRITGQALTALGSSHRSPGAGLPLEARAVTAAARRALGDDVEDAIAEGYARSRSNLARRAKDRTGIVREHLHAARDYIDDSATVEQLLATFGVDGAVDVGGTTNPLRVIEESRTLRAVRYPTDTLMLLPARQPSDILDAMIIDPRTIIAHLAEGKLLARRWVAEEVRRRQRVKLATEVRIYVLDGSTSMLGPRARMRDAILLAELVTLRARLRDPDRFYDPVLYYRYFTIKPWDTQRVATPKGCLSALSDVVSEVRIGETDIERALIASFAQIRDAQSHDLRLARASIVLVTDGEADVNHDVVWEAREAVGDLPVRVHIVALGEENPALRSLAARQRARGEEVVYQFLSDDFLDSVLRGYPDRSARDWLPVVDDTEELQAEFGALLGELEGLERTRDLEALAKAKDYQTSLEYLGVDLGREADGERARLSALHRDRRALLHRFERWFPEVPTPAVDDREPPRGTMADMDLGLVRAALLAVAETVDAVGSRGLRRQADAIELLERVLIELGVSPLQYAQVVKEHGALLSEALADVRRASHITT